MTKPGPNLEPFPLDIPALDDELGAMKEPGPFRMRRLCLMSGCETPCMRDSNYCEAHQWSAASRTVRQRTVDVVLAALIVLLLFSLVGVMSIKSCV